MYEIRYTVGKEGEIAPDMDVFIDEGLKSMLHSHDKDEYSRLKASIMENGIRDRIELSQLEDGRYVIVDGMSRFAIANEIGLQTIPFVVLDFPDGVLGMKAYILDKQLSRRNIKEYARLQYLNYLVEIESELARRRMAGDASQPEEDKGESVVKVAEKYGVSPNKLNTFTRISKPENKDVDELFASGVISISTAGDMAMLNEERRKKVISMVPRDEDGSFKNKDVFKLVKAEREEMKLDEKFNNAIKASPPKLVSLEERFREYYRNVIQGTVAGETISSKVKESRATLFAALSPAYKEALMDKTIRAEDVDVLLDEGILESTPIPNVIEVAREFRLKRAAEYEAKRIAALKRRQDTALRQEEEKKIIQARYKKRMANASNINMITRAIDNNELYCPIHGPDCGYPFKCGLDMHEAVKVSFNNICGLNPTIETVEVKVRDEMELQDKSKIPTTKIKHVPKRIDFGRLYIEEVPPTTVFTDRDVNEVDEVHEGDKNVADSS